MKVLVLSRAFPNSVTEMLGLWVRELVKETSSFCEPKVLSPVPYCPPFPGIPDKYRRFRKIDKQSSVNGIEVIHPRLVTGPGYRMYNMEWLLYYASVRRISDRLRKSFPFDLIHAHFSYPDGVVATKLGRLYNVPVVITEHIPWDIWTDRFSRVRGLAAGAVEQCHTHISVSTSVRKTVESVVGKRSNLTVIPNGVDGSVFRPATQGERVTNRILFAGAVRPIKGADILLKAMRLILDRGRDVQLEMVGEAYYEGYRREEVRLRQMVVDLGLHDHVRFVGKKSPVELAEYMARSAMLVLPSRSESFGVVLAEALACGTPVVATRCGGPEDIVNDDVGVLVPTDDPAALAAGIEHVLDNRSFYDAAKLRRHALQNFALDSVAARVGSVYSDALGSPTGRYNNTCYTNTRYAHSRYTNSQAIVAEDVIRGSQAQVHI